MSRGARELPGDRPGDGRPAAGGGGQRRRKHLYVVLAVAVACLGSGLALALGDAPACRTECQSHPRARGLPGGLPVQTVGTPLPVRRIGPGFIGLSIENYAVLPYAGRDPRALNPVFLQLVKNLNPGQAPVLRIGGDSADWAWVPRPGVAKPAGARFAITPRLTRVLGGMGRQLKARFILGLDLEAGRVRIARDEARAFLRAIGRDHVRAFELGNEPELYSVLGWAGAKGHRIPGRPPGYALRDYAREFRRLARALPRRPLAGPASGQARWSGNLDGFSATAPRLGVVTVHRYPLQRCQIQPGTPHFPTIARLLAPRSYLGPARSVMSEAGRAHAHGKSIRVDELNSVACFGAAGVSDTFASALWALETSFAMARVGVDGLNFHTLPQAVYGLFSFHRANGRWWGHVAPDYYGLLAFARVAPPGSRLLRTSVPARGVRMWATQTPSGTVNVALVNSGHSARTVGVRLPGRHGPAALALLRAPRLSSRTASLDGASFGGATTTGLLAERPPLVVRAVHGLYTVRVPTPSAALLTFSPNHSH